jgi:hypothetical protein
MAREAGVAASRLRRNRFRRVLRGVYVTADTPDSLWLRCAAAGLLLPEQAAFSHTTALAVTGLRTGDDEVHATVPVPAPAPRSRDGLVVHRSAVPLVPVSVHGVSITAPGRTLLDMAALVTRDELVVVGDHLVRRAGSVDALAAEVLALTTHPGRRRAASALPLVRLGVDSPQETRLRLAIVRFGLPEPQVALTVLDRAGEWLGEADLGYRWARVAIQYDGDIHRTSRRRWRQDIARDEAYRAEGWRVLRATGDDVDRPRRFCTRLEQALLDAAA